MNKKIVFLTRQDYRIAGGGLSERLGRVLIGKGFDVALIARGGGVTNQGLEVVEPATDPNDPPVGALNYLDADPGIGRAAKALEPDVLVATDPVTLRQAVGLREATGAGVLYASWEAYTDQVEQNVPPRWFRPFLVALLRRQTASAERRCFPNVDALLLTSEGHEGLLRKRYGRVLPPVSLVRNCPALKEPEPDDHVRRESGATDGEKILVYAGTLSPSRGLLPMLEAAERLGDGHRLVVLGWGMLKEEMERRAPANATILPPVPMDRLIAVLAGADVGMLPIEARNASKRESLACKLFEYLMAGLPIVATDLPGHRRVLEGTGTAALIPDASPESLAAGVREVLDAERASPGAFRKAALGLARDRYNLEAETPALMEAVERCL